MTELERYLDTIDPCAVAQLLKTESRLFDLLEDQAERIEALEQKLEELKLDGAKEQETIGKTSKGQGQGKNPVIKRFKKVVRKAIGKSNQKQPSKGIANVDCVESVTVAIPTYQANNFLETAVSSALNQSGTIPTQVMIIVNCNNSAWRDELEKRYADNARIEVLFTEKKGAAAARNVAIQEAKTSHLVFLDDDDWLSSNYVSSICAKMSPDADFASGPMHSDNDADHRYDYYNSALQILSTSESKNSGLTGIFSTVAGKLMSTSFLRRCEPFNEKLKHTEDVMFWAHNYDKVRRHLPVFLSDTEGYVRRVRAESLSRPDAEREYAFYVTDRLAILLEIESLIFEGKGNSEYKNFLFNLISAQEGHLIRYVQDAPDEIRSQAIDECARYEGLLLNRGQLSNRKAIAFCHNFSPTVDPSAFVATKRLSQIDELEGESLAWYVFSKNMLDIRERDRNWDMWFARFTYVFRKELRGKTSDHPVIQINFGAWARWATMNLDADVIYSRSMFPGSHVAAYLYKRDHPDAIWYAEFSDPIAKTSFGTPRDTTSPSSAWLEPHLYSFFSDCEQLVYEHADYIIFTNDVQKQYMFDYCPNKEAVERAEQHAHVLAHPRINSKWANVIPASYKLDEGKINVGYFGSFYIRRNFEDLLALSKDSRFSVHLFVPNPEQLAESLSARGCNTVRVNELLPQFEYLNLASRMDFLFINDMDPLEGVTPWLPSKLSDYLSVGTPVIAKCNPGSPMDCLETPLIHKTYCIDDGFLESLVCDMTGDKG